MLKPLIHILMLTIAVVFIGACGKSVIIEEPGDGPPLEVVNIDEISDPIPVQEPKSTWGNPASYVVFDKRYNVLSQSKDYVERGIASWYGRKFHGRKTSNGETYDMLAMTAAHKTLPLPTYVKVTNLENNRNVIVRVNDRGPFHENRIIDLSYAAAMKLGIHQKGTGFVEITALTDPSPNTNHNRPKSPLSDHRDIYLQVGAFTDFANAVKLKNEMTAANFSAAKIAEGTLLDNPIFRVLIGPISSVTEADTLAKRLAEWGIDNARYVVPEEVETVRVLQ